MSCTTLKCLENAVLGPVSGQNLESGNGLKSTMITVVFSMLKINRRLTIFEKQATGRSRKNVRKYKVLAKTNVHNI